MFEITKIVSLVFRIDYLKLFESSRKREIVEARQAVFYIAYKTNQQLTLEAIGEYFNKNHATVIHGIKSAENLMGTNKEFALKLNSAMLRYKSIGLSKVTYIAHPLSNDVKGNIEKILAIVKEINLKELNTIPFVPYLADILALDDSIPEHRLRGISNNLHYLRSGMVSELRVYGDFISKGVAEEIKLCIEYKIPVVYKLKQ